MPNSVEWLYTARMGIATASVPNPNLDGTGDIQPITVGADNGTLIKTEIAKAITDTSEGMLRIFISKAGGPFTLLSEIMYQLL